MDANRVAFDGSAALDLPAYAGGSRALTATPVVGTPARAYPDRYVPGQEDLAEDEVRVVMLGSGPLFPRRVQASPSVLMEFGNGARLVFDAGAGSVANLHALRVPQAETRTVFLSHLHIDHVADFGLHWLLGLPFGRQGPLEVFGPSGSEPNLGTAAFVDRTIEALRWDVQSRTGVIPTAAATVDVHEFDYARTQVVYDRDGVAVTAFPVVHGIGGAVGYRIDYRGRSVVYSGDTKPSRLTAEHGAGVDLLLHEAVPPPGVMAAKAGLPPALAERVVLGLHTPPRSAGIVFAAARPRMAAMIHTFLAPDTVGPMFADLRETYDGPATLTQELTVFDLARHAVVARQAVPDENAWPVPNRQAGMPAQVGERTEGLPEWLAATALPVPGGAVSGANEGSSTEPGTAARDGVEGWPPGNTP